MKKTNRVYGLIGISSVMANWNADFTGHPKATSMGEVFGSDKALKYSIKKYWKDKGEKILYIRTYKIDKDKLQPKDPKERYTEIFEGSTIDKKTTSKEVLKNLFSATDIMNFGATFAVEKQNISITGAVQVGQGFNLYEDTTTEIQDILSPFRNSKKEEADASSLGKKIMSSEAHYIYPFSINPNNYNEYIGLVDGFEGYTEEAYNKFKDGAMVGATALNTNSKSGCENEFALFIEFKENENIYLPHLDKYVGFEKIDGLNVYDLSGISTLFTDSIKKCINKIEVYYNPAKVKVNHELNNIVEYNIFTKEPIK